MSATILAIVMANKDGLSASRVGQQCILKSAVQTTKYAARNTQRGKAATEFFAAKEHTARKQNTE
ncbi:MAG: hypothetical protein AAB676_18360 [Verrucomicrobiota bacterium]